MSSTIQDTHEGDLVYHRYLEFVGPNADNASGKSDKFYEVAVVKRADGKFVVVRRWGKYGTKGQTKEEVCSDKWAAKAKARDLKSKKRAKGYTKEIDVITRLGTLVNGDAA